ncbi:MAG: isoprenylcysteine carboxylmethyltransferase family protein [Chloroflexi bacterium]|nr:isoprenylcysteine carboxylmethyltransferase family protein [Chloroflexota bacterium]
MENISAYTSPWLILLAFAIYSVLHSLLASQTAKDLATTFFGRNADRLYRIFFNVFGTVTLLPILGLPVLFPDQALYTIPPPWAYLLAVIQGLAAVMMLVVLLQTDILDFLGIRQLFAAPNEGPQKLVMLGFYKWVRHPLYTAGLLFIWFSARMTLNLLALNASITLYILIGVIFEERKLVKEFGEEYEVYQAQIPILIPWLKLK